MVNSRDKRGAFFGLIGKGAGVGHVDVIDPESGNVLLSQFPEHHSPVKKNMTLSASATAQEEGRLPTRKAHPLPHRVHCNAPIGSDTGLLQKNVKRRLILTSVQISSSQFSANRDFLPTTAGLLCGTTHFDVKTVK